MSTVDLKLPDIGEGVTEGEMVSWLVGEGDQVEADQPVAEIMTDKATVEVPAPDAGTISKLIAKEGDTIPVGQVMLTMEVGAAASTTSSSSATASSSSKDSNEKENESSQSEKREKEQVQEAVNSASADSKNTSSTAAKQDRNVDPPVADSTVLASPSTRRLAREMNVDINSIKGTGLAGRVTREDLESYGEVAQSDSNENLSRAGAQTFTSAVRSFESKEDERVPLKGIRKKIAENMQMAKRIVPHFTLMDEADVTELVKIREQAKKAGEKYGVKITYLPFVMKALIATVREFPMFNASIDDDAGEIVYKKNFNIGFAADTPSGLMVPVIKNADQKTLLELSAEIIDLSKRARDGKLKVEEMKGATITITNIGSVGGTYATPIINHPEVAIIGMYKMIKKPMYVEKTGKFKTASMMNYTVTADHRLIDGAVAANFLKSLFSKLENPAELMIGMI